MSIFDIDSAWDFDRPADTERKFREVAPAIEASGDAALMVELLSQIARTYSLRRQFEDAHATLDQAENIEASRSGRPRVRVLLERGRAYNSSKRPDDARPLFVEAWDLARQVGEDGLAVDAAHMVAIVEEGEEALRWNIEALALATSSTAPAARRWRKSLHNNIGWTHFEMGRPEVALTHFENTQACAVENGDAGSEAIARWSIAKAMRVLGRVEEAMSIQAILLAESEASSGDPGYRCEEMAECLLALGRVDEAKPYFARAYASLSADPWLAESEPDRIERLKDLS